MSNVFIFTNGGTKSQRQLTEDITAWFINAKLPRFKNFTIEIDLEKLNDDFLTCLFHELTHVEQHLRNKFGIREGNDKIHYLDRPYEIDAYAKQEQLLEEYRLCS